MDAPVRSRLVRALPWVGGTIVAGEVLGLVGLLVEDRSQFLAVLAGIGLLFLAGKEASIPSAVFGAGGNPWVVGLFVWLTDVAAVSLVYPLVHAALDGVQRRGTFLGTMLRNAQRRAARKRKVVDRFGPPGLYLFLIIPFAFNSPLVGIVLGRIAGMKPIQIAPIILAAITTTALAWTLLSAYGLQVVRPGYTWVPLALSLTVTATVLLSGYIVSRRQRGKDGATDDGAA
jgi:uncharacterized membrane protein